MTNNATQRIGPFIKHEWPSREKWAERERTLYGDEAFEIEGQISYTLSDYANLEEIEALKAALKARRLTYKTGSYERMGTNAALRLVKENRLPVTYNDCCGAKDLCEPFQERRSAVCLAAVEAAKCERAKVSIDDTAWEQELQRRRELEEWQCRRASPPACS
jgi:hypothetical protein